MSKNKSVFNKDAEPGNIQSRLETVLEMSLTMGRIGSWQLDNAGKKLQWSKELYRLLALEPTDSPVEFNRLFRLIHPEDRERVEKVYQRSLTRGSNHDIEYRIVSENDTIRYFRDQCRLIFTGGNKSNYFIGVLQEITDLKEARLALKNARDEMDSFANIVSHDLQESLRAVVGFLHFLKKKNIHQLDENGRLFVERSVKAGKRMQEQINALLQFARISSRGHNFVETNLNTLFAEVAARLDPYIQEKEGRITCSQLPIVMVDSKQIATLFLNLLHNGLYYNDSKNPSVEFDVTTKQEYFQFSCIDNGIGIAEQFHRRIFKVFQRLHSQQDYQGIGMGLSVSKKIIERHGGSIWVESKKNKGSCIYFTLPRKLQANN